MPRRKRMSKGRSRREFRKGVKRQHPKNRLDSYFTRGGIRL